MKHNKEYSIPLSVILFHGWYFSPPSLIKLTSQFHSSHLNSLVRRGILRVAHRSIQHNDLGRSYTQISFPKSTAVTPLCLSAFQSTEMLLVQDGSSVHAFHLFPNWPSKNKHQGWKNLMTSREKFHFSLKNRNQWHLDQIHIFWTFPEKVLTSLIFN